MSGNTDHTPAVTRGEAERIRRALIIDALIEVVAEAGYEGASVTAICRRAKVSRDAFYASFESREVCFIAMMDEGIARTSALIEQEFRAHEHWLDGVRGALAALLSFLDAQPHLTRAWLIETLGAGAWALECRERHVAALTETIVDYWEPPPGFEAHPRAAQTVMAALLGMVQSHLITKQPTPLVSLLGPMMGVVCAPYLTAKAVSAQIQRADELAERALAGHTPWRQPEAAVMVELPGTLRDPRARRARDCLAYLACNSGASNRQVARAVGIASHAQASTLLLRLARTGLLLKQQGRPGYPNAWSLTARGRLIASALQRERVDAPGAWTNGEVTGSRQRAQSV